MLDRFRMLPRALAALLAQTLVPATVFAQLADVRPGDEPIELPRYEEAPPSGVAQPPLLELPEVPSFTPPPRPRGDVLPPLELPSGADTAGLEGGAQALVREVRVVGNTVLAAEALEDVLSPYVDRELSFEDLQQLRDDLTLAYVERGYVTSGAVIPSQSLQDGILEVWVVEGRVTAIDVKSDGRLRDVYVRQRLERAIGPPVDVNELERALQILQQDSLIKSVNAQLVPGERRGEAVLRVAVAEARSWNVRLAGNNYSSPAIGGGRGELRASWQNVTGFGDTLWAEYKAGVGLQDVRAHWEWPISPWDTQFEIHFRKTWSEVVEAPFDQFDISSQTDTYGFELSQPVYRSQNVNAEAFVIGEYRRSDSFLFDEHFSFVPGPDNGIVEMTVLRFGGSYTWRDRNQVVAARSMVSAGLPWLGATRNSGSGVPDAEFIAWLTQLQWARRFPEAIGLQIVARGDVQISDRPLFGLEQFAVGGHSTVRGYRENRFVRDNGAVGSLELRLPVPMPSWREWRPTFEIAPFYDVGYSWNSDRGEIGDQLLMSIGVGGRFGLSEGLDFQIYWGHDLKDVVNPGDATLQDDGVSLGVVWQWP